MTNKRFKKIYIEITNNCNLNCSFCSSTKREKKFIKYEDFCDILDKIKPYTNYLYFHVLGEPLLHPEINELINKASQNFFVNITTNGYLIDRIKDNPNIRQINISLHSFFHGDLNKYLNNIFVSVDKLLVNNTYVSFRLWTNTSYKERIIKAINDYYNVNINGSSLKIKEKLYLNVDEEFSWPTLTSECYSIKGSCLGTISHIGILVDGTVIPCCLDSEGNINLGNVYKIDFNDIITSEKFNNIFNGFKSNEKREELCRHCNFYDGHIKHKE